MRKPQIISLVLVISCLLGASAASEPNSLSQADVDSIVRKVERAYANAYSKHGPAALAPLFTENATVQTETGNLIRWADVRARMKQSPKTPPFGLFSGAPLENAPISSTAVTNDVIVVHGKAIRRRDEAEKFMYTRVLVRHGEDWLIAASQIASIPRSH